MRLDKGQLWYDDQWDRKIRRNMKNRSLFIPVVSSNAESRLEGYFRREWTWAADRAERIALGVAFIIPPDRGRHRPRLGDGFRAVLRTRKRSKPRAVKWRLKSLVRDYHRHQRAT